MKMARQTNGKTISLIQFWIMSKLLFHKSHKLYMNVFVLSPMSNLQHKNVSTRLLASFIVNKLVTVLDHILLTVPQISQNL
jgi:hypothetical protein